MELKELMAPVLKWWWLIVAAVGVAAISNYLAIRPQPPVYQAVTTLMIGRAINNPNPTNNEFQLSEQLANTYADIARRQPIRDRTKSALGLDTLPDYSVRALPNTELIEIVVRDISPERAQTVANELANQLILQSPTTPRPEEEERRAFINQQLSSLQVEIEETQSEILVKQEELQDLASARDLANLRSEITLLEGRLRDLRRDHTALLANTEEGAINTLSVIDPAVLPVRPADSNRLMSVLLAAAVGFVLATSAAYLLEYLDDTLKSRMQVEQFLKLPLLGALSRSRLAGKNVPMLSTVKRTDPMVEEYRRLRARLLYATAGVDHPVLLVTSPSPGEGKSSISANLAMAIAMAGREVILVDADLHQPSLHRLFGVPNTRGLTNLLIYPTLDIGEVLVETGMAGVRLLPSGPLPPNQAELLTLRMMRSRLEQLKGRAFIVIVDGPPVLAVSDASVLGALCSGVLLVVRSGKTRKEPAQQAIELLKDVGQNILGVILNNVPSQRAAGYYYHEAYSVDEEVESRSAAPADGPAVTALASPIKAGDSAR